MKQGTFKGGVHPYEGKELSMNAVSKEYFPKGECVYPLSQHIGAPATPVVQVGDHVLVGQTIAQATGFISANVISACSGTVKSIEPRTIINGTKCNSIVIDNDCLFEPVEGIGEFRNYKELGKQEIRDIVKDAGIVGLGGAGFPTHVKLTPKDDKAIEYCIVNAAECEPYLTSDYRLMIEEPEKVIGGLKIMLSLFENAKGIIAIESNKPEAISILKKYTNNDPDIEVCVLKTKYPQGGERSIIYAVTGRTINSKMLPADAGCIVDNVDTVVSIFNAVTLSTPLLRRVMTITGDAVANPCNLRVALGTNYKEIIEEAGGFKEYPEKIISGGPMMGQSMFTLDLPVQKNSSALTCFTKDYVAANTETACIRCGRCVRVCPSHIFPVEMMDASLADDIKKFEELDGMECVECGSCAYICPAKRPLTQAFKDMRKKVAAERRRVAQLAVEEKVNVEKTSLAAKKGDES